MSGFVKRKTHPAFFQYVIAMLIFGTIGIFRKFTDVPSGFLACIRGFLGAVFLLIVMKMKRKKILQPIGKKSCCLLILTGAMIGFNWILLFEAYEYTTVAVATLCYYMAPALIILVSPFLFKEKITPVKGICVVLSLLGMGLVSGIFDGGSISMSDGLGILFGLGAAVLYASVVVLNKKISVEDPYEKTLIQLGAAALVLLPYVLVTEDLSGITFDRTAFIMLFVMGFVHTGFAYTLYFGGIGKLPAQTVALFSYLDPVFALILSALFLREKMSALGILGAVMIIGAAVFGELTGKKNG